MTVRHLSQRRNVLWIAALVHRLSGLALAIFLPVHFLTLGLAIHGEAPLESFLRWSDQPLVKLAESGLVFLLMLHMLGGLRLLVIENLPWRDGQKEAAAIAAGLSAAIALFLLARMFWCPHEPRTPQVRYFDPRLRRRRPVCGAACTQGQSRPRGNHREQGPAWQMRLHAHGAG